MDAQHPVLLYDNDCGICSRFARAVRRSSRGWIETVGLFTEHGRTINAEFFNPKDTPDEMFWILLVNTGYGGRSGLIPLAKEIVRGSLR